MINQPPDFFETTDNGSISFTWNPNFSGKWNGKMQHVQQVVGQDALKFSEPYVPFRTGRLLNSGKVDENGTVTWSTPYARVRYYKPGKRQTGLRGAFWFHRMKETHMGAILKDAQKALGE